VAAEQAIADPVSTRIPAPVRRFNPGQATSNVALAVLGCLFFIPLLWLLSAAFDKNASYAIEWPHWSFHNFAMAYSLDHFTSFVNSAVLSLVATIVGTVPAFFAGYALSRHAVPGKRWILIAVLFLTGIPITILIIPVFELFSILGWLSIIPAGFFLGVTTMPFEIWIIKTAIDSLPRELDEAAIMERASTLQVLWRVILPLSAPGIGAAAILGFVNAWGNFLIPLILLQSATAQPVPVTIYSAVSGVGINYGMLAAYSLLYAIPVLVLYAIIARLFRGGSVVGGAIQGV
jgi:multiple sugar transport system permease protein